MSVTPGAFDIARQHHRSQLWRTSGAALVTAAIIAGALAMFVGSDGSDEPTTAGTPASEMPSMQQLVNAGLVPREALQPRQAAIKPLYTTQERALMAAVASGQVPEAALDQKELLIKRLVDQGLIPRRAAGS